MAVSDIQATVLRITGVSPTANSVEDGQRFVVSSVPKELLMFAQKASSPSTDGSAISFSVNDSITDVQRNGYGCTEIPMSDASWVLDSSSLRFATAKRPVFYHKQGAVHFAPVTDGSNAGYVFYVDFSLIDDSCDLRNAVIYNTSAHEFAKLAVYTTPTVGGTADELTDVTVLNSENTIDVHGDSIEVDQWFATAAHLIEDEEDSELAQLQLSKISAYVQAYGTELQKANAKAAHYLQMTDKYYQWSKLEVQQYIQNNSKMIQAGVAMQASQQQGSR